MKKKNELDSFGLAGVIVNIIVTSMVAIGSIVLFILGIVILIDSAIGLLHLFLGILFETVSILAIIFNAKVLAGEMEYKKVATIFGFICLSILGSVLLSISNMESDEIKIKNEDSLAESLKKLKDLLDSNTITEDEFCTLKKKIIN